MIESLQQFVSELPAWLQWGAIALISAIPFVESYLGATIGVLVGMNPLLAIPAAVLGNAASVIVVVYLTKAVRKSRLQRVPAAAIKPTQTEAPSSSLFSPSSLPAVTILGQLTLASQLVAAAQVGKGAKPSQVIFWQIVSITLWAKVFALVAAILVT